MYMDPVEDNQVWSHLSYWSKPEGRTVVFKSVSHTEAEQCRYPAYVALHSKDGLAGLHASSPVHNVVLDVKQMRSVNIPVKHRVIFLLFPLSGYQRPLEIKVFLAQTCSYKTESATDVDQHL